MQALPLILTGGLIKQEGSLFLKRKYCVILSLFLLSISSLHAQSKIDSLRQTLETTRGVHRAEILLELAEQTRQTYIEKAIRQAEEALLIARRQRDEELQSKSLAKLGFFHSIIEQDTTALKYYLSALKMERRHGHRLAEAVVLHDLGRFYSLQENHPKALNYFLQALRIRQSEGEKSDAASTLMYIGDVYLHRDELKQAASFYIQAFELGRVTKNQRIMAMAGAKAAINLNKLGEFNNAVDYFDKALNAAKALNSIHAQAGILLAMSTAYREQNLYEKALALNSKQIEIAESHESKLLIARGYENLAGLYESRGNLERSNLYLIKAKNIYEGISYNFLPAAIKLIQNYLRQGQILKAIQTGEVALKQSSKNATLHQKKNLFEALVQAYTKQEDLQSALTAQSRLININERIYNEEKSQQFAEMQTRYETQQKEQEIALLQKKQENAELLRNALIVGLLLILIIAFLIHKRQRLKIKKNKTDLENTRLKEQQLKQDVEFKNKQLTTHSLNLVQKNEVMKDLKQSITDIQQRSNGSVNKNLRELKNLVNYSFNLDEDWEEFKHYFEEVHTGFFEALKKQFPDLTTNEFRLSALVKLNLTSKEIATIMNISPGSVKTARYRLRKKLNMNTNEDLCEFMMNVEERTAS